jgi:glyoxylase I family protein
MSDFNGVHVALTVSDLSVSAPWYRGVFGGEVLFEGNDGVSDVTILSLPRNMMLGLRQHSATSSGDQFAYERVGLDHAGFHVSSPEDLDGWQKRLEDQGVDHSGVKESPFGHHLNFKDPDGIALELFAPKAQT